MRVTLKQRMRPALALLASLCLVVLIVGCAGADVPECDYPDLMQIHQGGATFYVFDETNWQRMRLMMAALVDRKCRAPAPKGTPT